MAKHSVGWVASQKRWLLAFLVMLSVSTLIAFFVRAAFDTCDRNLDVVNKRIPSGPLLDATPNPLSFMKSKLVLLVSHELSLSGTFCLINVEKLVFFRNEKIVHMNEIGFIIACSPLLCFSEMGLIKNLVFVYNGMNRNDCSYTLFTKLALFLCAHHCWYDFMKWG